MIEMTLQGGDALDKKFRNLELKVAKKVRKDAVRAAAKPVKEAAKAKDEA